MGEWKVRIAIGMYKDPFFAINSEPTYGGYIDFSRQMINKSDLLLPAST